ncbi:putative bifunctional diguanylate cyclase/phosphodiesterase, partial [Salinisphaera orenii]
GDEFLVLVNELDAPADAAATARQILATLLQPIDLNDREFRITASIGIAMFPDDASDASELMKHADMAMYAAKEEGKNTFQFYAPAMQERSLRRIEMENQLRRALDHDELSLAYQAKISLASDQIIGAEALLRWQSPELGEVTPSRFLPLAEELGLILPIGRWVLETACAQNMAWQREGMNALRMAVNLSPAQFADPELVSHLRTVLADTGMPAHLLELEITETAVMRDVRSALARLTEIKALGVVIAIDDFGTGYSSLTQLRRLPVDTLKIDRSFVRDLSRNTDDQSIARAIITMGRNLSLNVIAEGVETEDQRDFLRSQACDDMQGYYFSPPVDQAAFADLVHAHGGHATPEPPASGPGNPRS